MKLRVLVAVAAAATVVTGGSLSAYAAHGSGTPDRRAHDCGNTTRSGRATDTKPGWSAPTTFPGVEGQFSQVAAAGSNDIWAAGGTIDTSFLYHYTNGCWQPVALPAGLTDTPQITSSGAGNTWLVNWNAQTSDGALLHWRNGTWTEEGPRVTAAAAEGTNTLWVAGAGFVGSYDGTSTDKHSIPDNVIINRIRVLGTDDVWAVGSQTGSSYYAQQPYALHWDGSTWQQTPMPTYVTTDGGSTITDEVSANDVAGSGNDVYAAGFWHVIGDGNDTGTYYTVVLHWDGTSWSKAQAPTGDAAFSPELAASRHGGLWVFGPCSSEKVLYRNPDGTSQCVAVSDSQRANVRALAAVPGTKRVIGVGSTGSGSSTRPAVMYDK